MISDPDVHFRAYKPAETHVMHRENYLDFLV